jgi:DNA-binding beta-propeller fold protein YncE
VLDGQTGSATLLGVGIHPQALAVNPITNHVYVVNYDGNTVTVIDGAPEPKRQRLTGR